MGPNIPQERRAPQHQTERGRNPNQTKQRIKTTQEEHQRETTAKDTREGRKESAKQANPGRGVSKTSRKTPTTRPNLGLTRVGGGTAQGWLGGFASGQVGVGIQHAPRKEGQTYQGETPKRNRREKTPGLKPSKKANPRKSDLEDAPPGMAGSAGSSLFRPWSGWCWGPSFPRRDNYYDPNPTLRHRPPRKEDAPTSNPPWKKRRKRNRLEKNPGQKPTKKTNAGKGG